MKEIYYYTAIKIHCGCQKISLVAGILGIYNFEYDVDMMDLLCQRLYDSKQQRLHYIGK